MSALTNDHPHLPHFKLFSIQQFGDGGKEVSQSQQRWFTYCRNVDTTQSRSTPAHWLWKMLHYIIHVYL